MTTTGFFETVEKVFETWRYDHPRILYALCRSLRPRTVIDCGTYRGYSACYMAQACKENGYGHVHAIDDFSEGMQRKYDADHWRTNVAACGLTDWCSLIVGKSQEVKWPEKVDFAYIDGWHGYRAVEHDFLECHARGAECICLDDVTSTVGPSYFIQKMRTFLAGFDILELHRDCGLAICMRRKPKPPLAFSQELPFPHPGATFSRETTIEQKREHLREASKVTGIDYSGFEVT